MQENIKELFQEYQKAQKNSFLLKINTLFNKIELKLALTLVFSAFLIPLLIGFNSSVLYGYLSLMVIAAIYVLCLSSSLIISSVIFTLSKEEKIRKKISTQKYTGDIYEIFDKNCPTTIKIIQDNKDELSTSVFENKGLCGGMLFNLMVKISNELEKDELTKLETEEKEALIAGETKIGNMLKAIKEV